jgi:hypothetical protein
MPWYTTLYNADSSPLDAERLRKSSHGNGGYHTGRYATRVYARSKWHAEELTRERGLNEVVWIKSRAPNYPRASTALRKHGFRRDVLHNLCFMAHLALKSGAATSEELLGDEGLIHEYIHGTNRQSLIAECIEIEKRIPGYLGPEFR